MAQFRTDTHEYDNTGTVRFETVMLADQYGELVGAANPSGMAVDAFGRARVATPVTLFDSFHRYQDNGKVSTYISGGGTSTYDINSSSILMNVGTASGDEVIRETNRVFAYQPGKSLQILITFCFNEAKDNLRNRAGYFDAQNGIFLQRSGSTVSVVRRSYVTGSVVDTVVNQANWNMDKLDGSGPSKITLDLTKTQIFFMDIEWLGVGTVRCGFVIDGKLIHVHSFHHANATLTAPYMTTAMLPGRVEISNLAEVASASTQRQICFSVISEGGYELSGRPKTIEIPVGSPRDLSTAGTYYPVLSLRLKSDRLNSIVLPKNFSLLGIGNNTRMAWKLINNTTLTGANWVSAGADSYVEYDMSATALSGGTSLASGYTAITNQAVNPVTLDSGLFKYQLERNPFTATAHVFTLAIATANNGDDVLASMDWQEI